jgi:hypothetical protein
MATTSEMILKLERQMLNLSQKWEDLYQSKNADYNAKYFNTEILGILNK